MANKEKNEKAIPWPKRKRIKRQFHGKEAKE